MGYILSTFNFVTPNIPLSVALLLFNANGKERGRNHIRTHAFRNFFEEHTFDMDIYLINESQVKRDCYSWENTPRCFFSMYLQQ
jgi:hypothetical protein